MSAPYSSESLLFPGTTLNGELLPDRAMRLVDGRVCMGRGSSIGVGDGNPTEALPADHAGPIVGVVHGPLDRIVQCVIAIGITVWPAIHGDRFDVSSRVKTTALQHSAELVPDFALEGLEAGREQILAAEAMLFPLRVSWRTRLPGHTKNHRLIG